MASRKPSINTKYILYENAKKLFFEKGYLLTSYNEICEKVDLNPAMLKYHFGSKKEIAALIYNEIVINLHDTISNLVRNYDDTDIVNLTNEYCFFNLVKTNLNFQRFYVDLCKERIINDFTKDTTFLMIQQYFSKKNITLPKSQLLISTSIAVAVQSELINDYFSGKLETDFDTVIDEYIKLMFRNLLLEEDIFIAKSKIAKTIVSKSNLNMGELFEIKAV